MSISLHDSQNMMPSIDEGSVPNLKDLLLSRSATALGQQDYINRIDQIKNILAEKLRKNLQSSCFLPVMVAGNTTAPTTTGMLNMQ